MKKLFLKLIKQETGTVIVLVAVSMMAFCGFSALVTDAGLLYVNKARLSNALDSAVLAGAQELPKNPERALQVAKQYAILNGVSNNEVSFSIEGNNTIKGSANREVNLLFARVLGKNSAEVPASAAARVAPIVGTSGIRPFGVLESNIQKGSEVVLRPSNASEGAWCFLLQLGDKGGNSLIRQHIEEGYSGVIEVASVIDGERGVNMSTLDSVGKLISDCKHVPRCTAENFVHGCSRIIIVPVVKIEKTNSSGQVETVRVLGFAAFFLNEYISGPKEIKGTFIDYITSGVVDPNIPDYGLYGVQLSK